MAGARSAGSSARLARPSIRSQARRSSPRPSGRRAPPRRLVARCRGCGRASADRPCFGFSSIGVKSTSPSRTKQIGTRRGRPSSAIVPSVAVRAWATKPRCSPVKAMRARRRNRPSVQGTLQMLPLMRKHRTDRRHRSPCAARSAVAKSAGERRTGMFVRWKHRRSAAGGSSGRVGQAFERVAARIG